MLPKDYNPFQSYDIVVPKSHLENVNRYSRTKSDNNDSSKTFEDAPFRRYIDVWVLALLLGRASRSFLDITEINDKHTFIQGTIFARKPEIINLMFAIAIDREGTHEVVLDSKRCLNICLSYAAGGLPLLFDIMKSGPGSPLSNLVVGVQDAIRDPESLQLL